MSIDYNQLKEVAIKPSLNAVGLYSPAAVNLLLGTCAQETSLGQYLVQSNMNLYAGGIGIFQMQKQPYDELWAHFIDSSVSMKAKIQLYLGYSGKPPAQRMATDLSLAAIMCRLYYLRVSEPLPDANDIIGMAKYWKKYYNTYAGRGIEDQFIRNYKEFCL